MLLIIMSLIAQRVKYATSFVFNKWELDLVFGKNGKWWGLKRTLNCKSNNRNLIMASSFTL